MTNTDAIETLKANYPDACYRQLREAVDAAIEALKAQDKTGDAVEVVRCKDCIHCTYDNGQLLYLCDYTPFDDYIQVAPLDYCSWGERRKDGKTD